MALSEDEHIERHRPFRRHLAMDKLADALHRFPEKCRLPAACTCLSGDALDEHTPPVNAEHVADEFGARGTTTAHVAVNHHNLGTR